MSSSSPPSRASAAAYGCFHRFLLASATVPARSGCSERARSLTMALRCLPIAGRRLRSRRVACQAMTETDPEGNGDDEEKEVFGDDASSPSADSVAEVNGPAESGSNIDNKKDETTNAELLSSSDAVQNMDGDATTTNHTQENVEVVEVASGSPLPGMKQQLDDAERIPKATIDIMKDQVFGFDTFFVTSQEPYEVNNWDLMIFLLYKSEFINSFLSNCVYRPPFAVLTQLMHAVTSRPALGLRQLTEYANAFKVIVYFIYTPIWND